MILIIQENTTANRYKTMEKEKPMAERSHDELVQTVIQEVVKPVVLKTYTLIETIFRKEAIQQNIAEVLQPQNPDSGNLHDFQSLA